MTTYAHIVGWGKYLPEKIVTNDDLAEWMDTSDEWIRSRTGIAERRHATENDTTASMAIQAARIALDRARITPSAVDLIIVATLSPEHIFPATASIVQDALGATQAGAFDLSAACSGFIYALSMGANMIQAEAAKVVVVIGSETVSRFLDPEDRGTYPLFGDGAGAIVLQGDEVPGGILSSVLGSDGSGAKHLGIFGGGSKHPTSQDTLDQRLHFMHMNGREVYRFATKIMGQVCKEACEKAGINLDEVDLLIPHQANIRIIRSAQKQLKLKNDDKVFTNLDKYGNTSAASVPIALCEALEQGRVQYRDNLILVGFGGGLSWGAVVIQWALTMPRQPRQWWYRGVRRAVYQWAHVRSNGRRVLRWLDTQLSREEEDYPSYTTEPAHPNGTSPAPDHLIPADNPVDKPNESK